MAAMPMTSTRKFLGQVGLPHTTARSKKLCPPPAMPNRLGSCVMMIVNPAPALKPTKMLSLMSLTSRLSRSNQAMRQSMATVKPAGLGDLGISLRVPLGHRPHSAGNH